MQAGGRRALPLLYRLLRNNSAVVLTFPIARRHREQSEIVVLLAVDEGQTVGPARLQSSIWKAPVLSPVKSCTSMGARAPVTEACAQRRRAMSAALPFFACDEVAGVIGAGTMNTHARRFFLITGASSGLGLAGSQTVFRRYVKATPPRYYLKLRLTRAVQLLQHTNKSLI